MCVHISLTTMTFAFCKLWWASYHAHTAFLLCVFAVSAWNGKPKYLAAFLSAAHQGKEGVIVCILLRHLIMTEVYEDAPVNMQSWRISATSWELCKGVSRLGTKQTHDV